MKKFSKIFENKQFHTWNVDMIKNKLKEIPNSTSVTIDTLFTYHTKDGDEICELDDKNLHDDALVSPLAIPIFLKKMINNLILGLVSY